jgi:Ca2+-binding EF-hand superfamily protein
MVCTDYSEETVVGLMHRVQEHVFPRRVRAKEFFKDCDPLRSGRCTVQQLAKALNQMGVNMADKEVEILAEHFTDHGPKVEKPAVVSYAKFCEALDVVFDSATGPGIQVSSSPGSTQLMTFTPKSIEEESEIYHLLHRFATLCQTRGITVKYLYTDLDRAPIPSPSRMNPARGGKVTKMQFIRNFPFQKEFTDEEKLKIAEHYQAKPEGDVHFQAMHNDVTEVMDHAMQPFPRSDLYLKPDDTEWSHATLTPVEKIRAKTVEKRCRLLEHFQDFDPLRKGYCTVGQVKAVFTIMNLGKEIDKSQFDELTVAYMREDGLFCYKDFTADCDSAFTVPNLEKDPLALIPMPDPSCTAPARRNKMTMSASRIEAVSKVEDKIKKKVRTNRIFLKPAFKDMDRANRGFITRNQFARVMNNLGFNLDDMAIGLLCGAYCNLGNHTDFNYADFNRAMDPPDEDEDLAMQQANAPYMEPMPQKYFDERGNVIPADVLF